MREFIDNSCELYEELSGRKLKPAASPFVNDGSLTVNDWESRGSLSHQASRILMTDFVVRSVVWTGFVKGNFGSYQTFDCMVKSR